MHSLPGFANTTAVTRLSTLAFYLAPMAFSLAVYGYGLLVSYHHDDWVWLGQYRRVETFGDVWHAIFDPSQHGTFRPLSERLPFLIFGPLFGDDALPFRILAFATHFANLVLFSRLVRELTGSRLAAFMAPILWTVNANLAAVMTWSCAYMQILCGFLLLAALTLFIRYARTGERRYYLWQWVPFVLGFGAMETTVVYPALAAAYALLYARKYLTATVPLFVASGAFLVFHSWHAPKQAAGPYSIHFDASILTTFATYWQWALTPLNLVEVKRVPAAVAAAAPWVLTAALASLLLWCCWRRYWAPVFFFISFGILLSPVLPLRDHLTDYYLTLPAMALAGLIASGLAVSWRAGRAWATLGVAVTGLFVAGHWPVARFAAKWWYQRTQRIDHAVRSVVDVRSRMPDKVILLAEVDDVVFRGAFEDDAFAAVGVEGVYLDPGSKRLSPELAREIPSKFILQSAGVRQAIDRKALVVYATDGPQLRNITSEWSAVFSGKPLPKWPSAIRLDDPDYSGALGSTWYPAEIGYRWMPKVATVRLAAPSEAGSRLHLRGHVPAVRARTPAQLLVKVDRTTVGKVELVKPDSVFDAVFDLPAGAAGQESVLVTLEVDRTFRAPPDPRELGAVLTEMAIKAPAATTRK